MALEFANKIVLLVDGKSSIIPGQDIDRLNLATRFDCSRNDIERDCADGSRCWC